MIKETLNACLKAFEEANLTIDPDVLPLDGAPSDSQHFAYWLLGNFSDGTNQYWNNIALSLVDQRFSHLGLPVAKKSAPIRRVGHALRSIPDGLSLAEVARRIAAALDVLVYVSAAKEGAIGLQGVEDAIRGALPVDIRADETVTDILVKYAMRSEARAFRVIKVDDASGGGVCLQLKVDEEVVLEPLEIAIEFASNGIYAFALMRCNDELVAEKFENEIIRRLKGPVSPMPPMNLDESDQLIARIKAHINDIQTLEDLDSSDETCKREAWETISRLVDIHINKMMKKTQNSQEFDPEAWKERAIEKLTKSRNEWNAVTTLSGFVRLVVFSTKPQPEPIKRGIEPPDDEPLIEHFDRLVEKAISDIASAHDLIDRALLATSLPESQKSILRLRAQGCRDADIAETSDSSPDYVRQIASKTRVAVTRSLFRELIKEYPGRVERALGVVRKQYVEELGESALALFDHVYLGEPLRDVNRPISFSKLRGPIGSVLLEKLEYAGVPSLLLVRLAPLLGRGYRYKPQKRENKKPLPKHLIAQALSDVVIKLSSEDPEELMELVRQLFNSLRALYPEQVDEALRSTRQLVEKSSDKLEQFDYVYSCTKELTSHHTAALIKLHGEVGKRLFTELSYRRIPIDLLQDMRPLIEGRE